MTWICHYQMLITLLTFFTTSNKIVRADIDLKFQIYNTGYHREISYVINGNGSFTDETFLIVQTLPASSFVNTDQLNDLKRVKHLEFYVPLNMDVELPASKGLAFEMYIFGTFKHLWELSLPIHFRYQSPTEMKFVRIDVHSPDLYRLCVPNVDANETCVQYPCRNASLVSLLSNLNEIEVCSWRKISTDHTTISVLIPAAYVYSYKFVLPITIAVTWLGSLYICFIIFRKSTQWKIKKL